MIKVGSNTVTFPYSKIYVGDTKVWEAQAPGPSQYLNYIESTGTQYIDTNFSASSTDTAEIEFELTDTTQTLSNYLTGSYHFVSGTATIISASSLYRGDGIRYAAWGSRRTQSETLTVSTPDLNKHTIKDDRTNMTIYFDGTSAGTYTHNFSDDYIYLFAARSESGTTIDPSGKIKARIYSFKVTDSNNQKLIELVPVLDGNGVPCMWDTVSQTFFYNQGTGDFLYG